MPIENRRQRQNRNTPKNTNINASTSLQGINRSIGSTGKFEAHLGGVLGGFFFFYSKNKKNGDICRCLVSRKIYYKKL